MPRCAKESGHPHTLSGDLCADSLPCLLPQVTIGASHEASERGNKRGRMEDKLERRGGLMGTELLSENVGCRPLFIF